MPLDQEIFVSSFCGFGHLSVKVVFISGIIWLALSDGINDDHCDLVTLRDLPGVLCFTQTSCFYVEQLLFLISLRLNLPVQPFLFLAPVFSTSCPYLMSQL